MNKDVSQTEETNNTSDTAGQLLKAARESRQWTHEEVAQQLKIKVSWVESIENDHYDNGMSLAYLRGYLRSYARLLGLDPDYVVTAFEGADSSRLLLLGAAAPIAASIRPGQYVLSKADRRSFSRSKWGWVVLSVLGLVGLLFWLYQHQIKVLSAQPTETNTVASVSQQPDASHQTAPSAVETKESQITETVQLPQQASSPVQSSTQDESVPHTEAPAMESTQTESDAAESTAAEPTVKESTAVENTSSASVESPKNKSNPPHALALPAPTEAD